jgi:aminoglycoside 6'-N-acetyltransferase I
VEPAARGQGFGTALVKAAEEWGRAQGCTELAPDTEIANVESAAVHRHVGFVEVERIICFRKVL